MADEPKFQNVKLVGRHVPDFSMELDSDGNKYRVPLPGEYEIGVMFGDAFHALHRFQAGNVLNADGSHKRPVAKKQAGDEPEPETPEVE